MRSMSNYNEKQCFRSHWRETIHQMTKKQRETDERKNAAKWNANDAKNLQRSWVWWLVAQLYQCVLVSVVVDRIELSLSDTCFIYRFICSHLFSLISVDFFFFFLHTTVVIDGDASIDTGRSVFLILFKCVRFLEPMSRRNMFAMRVFMRSHIIGAKKQTIIAFRCHTFS